MIDKAYTRHLYDLCVYFRKVPSEKYIFLLLHVDGMLIPSKNRSSIDKLKCQLVSEFKMMNLRSKDETGYGD